MKYIEITHIYAHIYTHIRIYARERFTVYTVCITKKTQGKRLGESEKENTK